MKLILQSFNLNAIFIIPIAFKFFERKEKKMEGRRQPKMHLDSFVDSLTLAFRDFKSKFYGILIHKWMLFLKSNKEKMCSQKIIQLPQSKYFSSEIFQEA